MSTTPTANYATTWMAHSEDFQEAVSSGELEVVLPMETPSDAVPEDGMWMLVGVSTSRQGPYIVVHWSWQWHLIDRNLKEVK